MFSLRVLILFIIVTVYLFACQQHKVSDGKVYFLDRNNSEGKHKMEIIGADGNSFEELAHSRYSRDNKHVYYEWRMVAEADPVSFESLTDEYGKDRKHVWKGERMINGAESASFEVLNAGPFSRDQKDFYFDTIALHVSYPTAFTVMQGDWARDSRFYYISGMKHAMADPATFEVLAGGYAKDKHSVYFLDSVVSGADPVSFKVLDYGVAKDKASRFEGNKKIDAGNKETRP